MASIEKLFLNALHNLAAGYEMVHLMHTATIGFFLMGITMFCVGITGEYIGRIYKEVRKRPRYIIRRKWSDD